MRRPPSASATPRRRSHCASLIEMSLGVAIGAITFTGSVIAFVKLSGRMSGKPIILPLRHVINLALFGVADRFSSTVLQSGGEPLLFWAIIVRRRCCSAC